MLRVLHFHWSFAIWAFKVVNCHWLLPSTYNVDHIHIHKRLHVNLLEGLFSTKWAISDEQIRIDWNQTSLIFYQGYKFINAWHYQLSYPYPCRCWLYLCYWIFVLAYMRIYMHICIYILQKSSTSKKRISAVICWFALNLCVNQKSLKDALAVFVL